MRGSGSAGAAPGWVPTLSGPAGRGPAAGGCHRTRVRGDVMERGRWQHGEPDAALAAGRRKHGGRQRKAGGQPAVDGTEQRQCCNQPCRTHQEVKGVASIQLEAPVAGPGRGLGARGVERAARRRGGASCGRGLRGGLGCARRPNLRSRGGGAAAAGWARRQEAAHTAVGSNVWVTAQRPAGTTNSIVGAPSAVGWARPGPQAPTARVSLPALPPCG